jgi:hypothetical protein
MTFKNIKKITLIFCFHFLYLLLNLLIIVIGYQVRFSLNLIFNFLINFQRDIYPNFQVIILNYFFLFLYFDQ